MKDLTIYSKQELSLQVFNDEYFYVERGHREYLLALVNEEFHYTNAQLEVLLADLNEDASEE